MGNKFADAMTAVAAGVTSEPSWTPYAEWRDARISGLHERAATTAERFAEAAQRWPFQERKRFTLWLATSTGFVMDRCGSSRFSSRFTSGGPGIFAPTTVVDAVVRPTLVEWRDEEPDNPEPHFWLGLYDQDGWRNLQVALRIDPAYGPARAAVALSILSAVEYNQHELPAGYLGNPADDLNSLKEVEALAAEGIDPEVRLSLNRKAAALRMDAEDWVRLRAQLKGLDRDGRIAIWRARRPV